MRRALLEEFMPTMKEAATVYAATKAIELMQTALAKVIDNLAVRLDGVLYMIMMNRRSGEGWGVEWR